jgi:hypothetical protein
LTTRTYLPIDARRQRDIALLARVLADVGSSEAFRVEFTTPGLPGLIGHYVDHGGRAVQLKAHELRSLMQFGLVDLARSDLFPLQRVSTYRVTELGHEAVEEWMERGNP